MARGRRALVQTIALSIIAATLGAWLAFVVFASEDVTHDVATSDAHGNSVIHPQSTAHGTMGLNHTATDHETVPVAVMMTADPDAVAFCVGASIEPFEGAMTQLRDSGPAEAAERMRVCVFEVIIGHGDDATMVDLEAHRAGFFTCFGELQNAVEIDKPAAVDRITACIMAGLTTN